MEDAAAMTTESSPWKTGLLLRGRCTDTPGGREDSGTKGP